MGMKMCDSHGWSLLSLGFFTCVAKTGWEMECTATHGVQDARGAKTGLRFAPNLTPPRSVWNL